jgi:cytochrome c-type biogenesis protein
MSGTDIPFGLAFFAGVASFISPCVLSLVPAYVGYLGSRAVTVDTPGAPGAMTSEGRLGTLLHGLFFVLGFSLIFIVLGLGASAIGALAFDALRSLVVIGEFRFGLIHIGGLVVIVFGLHTMGVIHIPWLEYDTRRQQPPDRSLGYLSSALMGVFFSAGWAPCVGPVLGAVLTMAMSSEGVARGGWLLAAYSAGLGIPFLLAAAGIGSVSELLRRYRRHLHYVSIATGAFLIIIGILLLTDQFSRLTVLFPGIVEVQIWIDENVVAIYDRLTGGGR